MIRKELEVLKTEVQSELINNILPFWGKQMEDKENGGFLGRMDGAGKIHPLADKGCVLNARILWTFSSAFRLFHKSEYLLTASRAKDYLRKYFFDKEFGGVFWLINYKGNIADGKKQIYAQAFTLYAMVEYYRATNDSESLNIAKELYKIIEKQSLDSKLGGYFEAFTREWGEIADLRLSTKDANEKKTMNTHLHVLEAYTNLYRVWKDDGLRDQLQLLIEIFASKIVNDKSFHLNMFFDENWNDKTDLISYGHDIESSWLLYEAAVVLGNEALIIKIKEIAIKIAHAASEGLQADGGLVYEKFFETGKIDTDRHWWVQSEAVVGFFNAWELTKDESFFRKTQASWKFISENIIDKERGEWLWSVDNSLQPNLNEDKAGFWKCPYHNGRMCMEIIERIVS